MGRVPGDFLANKLSSLALCLLNIYTLNIIEQVLGWFLGTRLGIGCERCAV